MKHRFRILENYDGECHQLWSGAAYDVDDAIERCYDDGGPGSYVEVTVQRLERVKLTRSISSKGWVTKWKGHIAP